MNKVLEYLNLIDMLREIDLERNDKETVREVLDYIADELQKFESLIREEK